MLQLKKFVRGPWEAVRQSLWEDLNTIETVINLRWAQTFGVDNNRSGGGGAGSVTNSGTLTDTHVILGAGGAEIRALTDPGDANKVLHGNAAGDPTYSAVDLAADVTGVLPVADGGTAQSSYTKGDILVARSATVLDKLAVGADNTVLIADSAQTDGVKWGSAALVAPTIAQVAARVALGV
jgi:hypothetical protein